MLFALWLSQRQPSLLRRVATPVCYEFCVFNEIVFVQEKTPTTCPDCFSPLLAFHFPGNYTSRHDSPNFYTVSFNYTPCAASTIARPRAYYYHQYFFFLFLA